MAILDNWKILPEIILFIFSFIELTNGGFQKPHGGGYNSLIGPTTVHPFSSLVHAKWNDPYFDLVIPTNVTALVGKSAYLSCRVKNLGNRTVSWIRHRDIHILTVATYTYTTDLRFQTTHHKDTDEWTLHIKWAQHRDGGMYECQVSTQPVKSYSVFLNVVDPYNGDSGGYGGGGGGGYYGSSYRPNNNNEQNSNFDSRQSSYQRDQNQYPSRNYETNSNDIYGRMYSDKVTVPNATILGGTDLYVDKGSTINLTCTIKFSPEPLGYNHFIIWYHQDRVINYESPRGGISITTKRGESTTSYLLIEDADKTDTGKYTCAPSNTPAASIKVHVLNGERPEAMKTGSSGLISSSSSIVILMILTIIYSQYQTTIITNFINQRR